MPYTLDAARRQRHLPRCALAKPEPACSIPLLFENVFAESEEVSVTVSVKPFYVVEGLPDWVIPLGIVTGVSIALAIGVKLLTRGGR